MLSTRYLQVLYLYLISIGLIFVSYWSNVSTVNAVMLSVNPQGSFQIVVDEILSLNFTPLMSYRPGLLIIQNLILQLFLSGTFCNIHLAPKNAILQEVLWISFVVPSLLTLTPLPVSQLKFYFF